MDGVDYIGVGFFGVATARPSRAVLPACSLELETQTLTIL
jgi:hypothetical protein